jgi:hypothetical protein
VFCKRISYKQAIDEYFWNFETHKKKHKLDNNKTIKHQGI